MRSHFYGSFFIVMLLLLLPAVPHADAQPWRDHTVFGINKLDPHATLFPYSNETAALAGDPERSPNRISLNGSWKFDWQRRPVDRPVGFEKPEFDDRNWGTIRVPGNWEVEGYGYPIYLDERYPFTTTWPDVPGDYNPIGSYRREFELPKDWQDKQVFLHVGAAKSASFPTSSYSSTLLTSTMATWARQERTGRSGFWKTAVTTGNCSDS